MANNLDMVDDLGLPKKIIKSKKPVSEAVKNNNHGGRRPGSGNKGKVVREATEDAHILYSRARAEHEEAKAKLAQLTLLIESGKYVSRDDVQRASAIALSAASQTLRAIPDNLERQLGVAPEVSENVAIAIDEVLADLALELEKMHNENRPPDIDKESVC